MKKTDFKGQGEQLYRDYFCQLKVDSGILNAGGNTNISVHSIMWDRTNIERELLIRQGNEKNGLYSDTGETCTAELPYAKYKLAFIEGKFNEYQKRQMNRGFEEPTEYPKELLDLKMKWPAKLDIIKLEIEKLEKTLKELDSVKEVKDDTLVLCYGLRCNGSFHGIGSSYYRPDIARAVLDGQYLTLTKDDILIIDDKRSPYDQMKVSDYRKMSKQWLKEREEKEQVRFKKLQASCRERGITVPSMPLVTSMKKVSKESLPKWPDWATKYTPPVPEADEDSSSMTRMKKRLRK
jgi:hypothetical protein